MADNSFKILQIIDTLNVGGAEKVFVNMCNILHENNHNVAAFFILNAGILDENIYPEIKRYELKREKKWGFSSMYNANNIFKNYDILHCHSRHVYRYIVLISKVFQNKKKIIFQDHFSYTEKIPLFFNNLIKPKYYIGVSKELCFWANNSLKIKSSNVFLLSNIIIKTNHQQLGKQHDLVLVSNIRDHKNQLFAVNLIKKITRRLTLVGRNQNTDYYKKIIENKDGASFIEIIEDCNDVQKIVNECKFGLHTSVSETGPLVLIEYLAQGIPFLAYETGEVAQQIKSYFPEFFIDNFDENQWIERIVKIESKQYDRHYFNEVFEKLYGKEAYYNKLNKIYEWVINY